MVSEIRLGAAKALIFIGDNAVFGFRSLRAAVRRPFHFEETLRQIYEVGYKSFPLIAAAGFAVGASEAELGKGIEISEVGGRHHYYERRAAQSLAFGVVDRTKDSAALYLVLLAISAES